MARAERDLGKPARASALARRALGIFEILRGSHGDAASRRLLAEISLARGAGARAERILAPARLVLSKIPAAEAIEVLRTAGLSARATGRRAEALRRLARAERLVEAQRRLIPGAELRARAFWRQARVYHDRIALELESRSPRFATLFRLAETARARGFRDRRARTPPATWRRLAERRALLGSLTRRLEEADPGGPRPASARDAAELRGRIQALEREILSEIHRIEAAELSPPEWHGASDPDRTASLLAAGEAFLSTFVAGDRVLVLILRREGREAVVLPLPAAEIRARVDRVQFQLDASALAARRTDANLDFLRLSSVAALRELHAAVLEPIEPHLPSEGRLLVSPHDFLHRVPFECLHDDLGPIDRRFRIARTPSADAVARRSAAAGGSAIAGTILVCGLVEGGPAFAAAEIESVASRFEGGRTRILRDPTSSELLGALAGCRVLHLATHGAFREDNPLFSRLTTSDGAIFLLDILATRIEADLVVLSACESGSTHAGGTDDISGVAHGFLAAGARRIVASRWRIHDEATAALMAAFYRRADGTGPDGDPAAALALAQQEVRERWSHPFFWAGFSLYEA